MANSETEIANSALVKIGEARIASLDDDTKAARACKRQYPLMRDLLLEEYNWTFAVKRAQLNPDGTDPAFGFSSRFLLPSDCLRFLGLATSETVSTSAEMEYSAGSTSFKIEGRYLLLDDTGADIFYIKRETNVILFSAQFVECLALRLAIDLAYDLTGGAKHEDALNRRFERQIRKAQLTQAIQSQPQIVRATEWVDSREFDRPVGGNPWAFGSSGF